MPDASCSAEPLVCAGNAKSFPFAEGIFSVTVSHVGGQANWNAYRARGVLVEWNLFFLTRVGEEGGE
jgi:hypothetical protein